MYTKLEEFLRAKAAKYELLVHPGAVTAHEQAAATHTPGSAFAKVVVVKERDGFVLAVLPACRVLDLNRLKGFIRHGEVRLATVEEIARVVPDCAPGAIPPFGALFRMATFVDRALVNVRDVTMPAGDFATTIRMRAREFRRLSAACIGEFAVMEMLVATRARDPPPGIATNSVIAAPGPIEARRSRVAMPEGHEAALVTFGDGESARLIPLYAAGPDDVVAREHAVPALGSEMKVRRSGWPEETEGEACRRI